MLTFPGAHAHDFVHEKPDWWVKQIHQIADFYYRSQFGDGEPNWREYRVGIDMTGNKVGDRQETDTISRLIYGLVERLPDDRRGSLPRGRRDRRRVPPRAPAQRSTRARASPTGTTPSRSTSRARRRSSPRSSATTTRRSRPTSRSTRWPARRRRSGSPAIRGSRTTSTRRSRCSSGSSTTPRTAATGRTSTRSRSTARASARPQPGAQELELGRRPRAGVPDQRLARDRRRQVHRHAGVDRRHHREALPGRRQQPVRPGAVPRGLEPRPDLGLAAEPGGRRAQPEDRLEPDAHPSRPPARELRRAGQQDQPDDARGRQRPAARRLVRRRRARPRRGPRVRRASPGTTARRGGSRSRRSSPT